MVPATALPGHPLQFYLCASHGGPVESPKTSLLFLICMYSCPTPSTYSRAISPTQPTTHDISGEETTKIKARKGKGKQSKYPFTWAGFCGVEPEDGRAMRARKKEKKLQLAARPVPSPLLFHFRSSLLAAAEKKTKTNKGNWQTAGENNAPRKEGRGQV